jgi:phospholipase A2
MPGVLNLFLLSCCEVEEMKMYFSDFNCSPFLIVTAALSGSTYTLSQWLLLHHDLDALLESIIPKLKADLVSLDEMKRGPTSNLTQVLTPVVQKSVFSKPISVADVFGALVSNQIFPDSISTSVSTLRLDEQFSPKLVPPVTCDSNEEPAPLLHLDGGPDPNMSYRYYPKLSDAAQNLYPTLYPWPLFTCVSHDLRKNEYYWLEMDPYHTNMIFYDTENSKKFARVPMWGLGRDYIQSTSQEYMPEMGLPLLMGLWGSAFSGSISHAWQEIKEDFKLSRPFLRAIDRFVQEVSIPCVV